MWQQQLTSAEALETNFGNKTGEGGFKPNVISPHYDDYTSDAGRGNAIDLAAKAYTEKNLNALNTSDSIADDIYQNDADYSPSSGTTISYIENGKPKTETTGMLSKADFYQKI